MTQTVRTNRRNGIDLDALISLASTVVTSESAVPIIIRTTHRWKDGAVVEGQGSSIEAIGEPIDRTHHTFHNDLPTQLLGTDTAPAPTESLLAAISACVTTSLVEQAAAEGVTLDRVEVVAEATLDLRGALGAKGVPVGPEAVVLRCHVEADAEPEHIEALINAGLDASPTAAAITHPTPIRLEIVR